MHDELVTNSSSLHLHFPFTLPPSPPLPFILSPPPWVEVSPRWHHRCTRPDKVTHGCCRQEIIEKLLGQVVRLSQHKFASNVIEKCLQCGDPAGRQVCSYTQVTLQQH